MTTYTYNEIWESFLLNTKTSDINLPSDEQVIYKTIRNAGLLMANRVRFSIQFDDENEIATLDRHDDKRDYLLLLTHHIRYVFLKNELTFFNTTWQPFQKDIGVRNFSTQLRTLTQSVEEQEQTIRNIIKNMTEDHL